MFFAGITTASTTASLASCKIIEMTAGAAEPLSRLFASIPHLRATRSSRRRVPTARSSGSSRRDARAEAALRTIDTDGRA